MTPRASSPKQLFDLASGNGEHPGDRRALARLLSLVERGGPQAREVARLSYPKSGRAYSIGLTGAPGAGKSTLASRLIGKALEETSSPVAVLAVDPSSPLSGGAILGDRVRMQDYGLDANVYIRSMASRGHLGGLAAAVPDAVRLLDAAGWPLVLVETVGVGQVEVEVAGACDCVVLVLNPGWGDAVQANKAGLLEVADVLVINKADRPGVRETRRDLVHMLQLTGEMDWTPPIIETVAATGEGVPELWEAISDHRRHVESTDGLERRRRDRMATEMERLVAASYAQAVAGVLGKLPLGGGGRDGATPPEATKAGKDLLARLSRREIDPATAADELVRIVAEASLTARRPGAP